MIKIRPAEFKDAAEIANVHTNSWQETYVNLLPQDFLDDRPLFFKNRYELWKRILKNNENTTFVYESIDNGVVGFIHGAKARDKKFDESYCEIWSLYLLKQYHGKKIGYQLLKAFFEDQKKKGFSKCYLWILEGNRSSRFYESTGAKLNNLTEEVEIGGQKALDIGYSWDNLDLVSTK